MQPEVGMKVIFRDSQSSTFTISKIIKVHDPLTGQDRDAFCLDLSGAVYFVGRFAEQFLVVLPQEGKNE